MPYELVVFDFDGTLADSFGWMMGVLPEVSERFGLRRVTRDELEVLRHQEPRAALAQLGVPLWKLPSIAMHVRGLAARDAERIALFPGALAALEAIEARGIALAIVSSNSEENVRRALGPHAARIRHYGCGAGMFGKRPKLRRVAQRAGVAPARVIAIGDEVRDIEAAAAEGMHTGAVTWGYAAREALHRASPTRMLDSFDELLRVVTG